MEQFLIGAAGWVVWVYSGAILVVAVLVALLGHYLVFSAAKRVAGRTESQVDDLLIQHGRKPARLIFPLLGVFLILVALPLPPGPVGAIRHGLGLALIASVAWLIVRLFQVFDDLIAIKYRVDVEDNLAARRIQTQVRVLRRIGVVIVGVVTLGLMLMTFPSVWNLGAGLFASAGAVGLIMGMAARPALSNLLAGIQIAMTQPIRLDDVVIVEGEWGWIEEIGATYVVVRIWDLRRLVLPLTYFMERPFQNWTRSSADILGTVSVYADYSVPVQEVREELHRILQASDLWDGKVWNLQVTNATEHTMELRALMSSVDSGASWNLRCHVREKLIAFLKERCPESLPRTRAEVRTAALA